MSYYELSYYLAYPEVRYVLSEGKDKVDNCGLNITFSNFKGELLSLAATFLQCFRRIIQQPTDKPLPGPIFRDHTDPDAAS